MTKIELNKYIYTRKNVDIAREAYRRIARIMVIERRKCIIVLFVQCKYGSERTVKEFENYLIGLENS